MGGWGSGRRSSFGSMKVSDCCAIDINSLRKRGYLHSGCKGRLRWSYGDEQIASVDLCVGSDRIHLSYGVYGSSGDRKNGASVVNNVLIVRTKCRFGGSRPYFICPGVDNGKPCSRNVCKLYQAGKRFLCRRCLNLRYSSQSESRLDRKLRRANKIRELLGGEPGFGFDFPSKPKGMWWRSYEKLYNECNHTEYHAKAAMAYRLTGVLGRTEYEALAGSFRLKP